MRSSLILFNLILKIWKKSLAGFLDTTQKKVQIGILFILFFGICFFTGYLISGEILTLFLNGDSRALYLLLLSELITISFITVMFFILLRCLTPEQNTITRILICFPIKEIEKKIGYYLPVIINIIFSSFLFVFIIYIPAMLVNKIDLMIIFGFIFCLLLQSIIITLFLFSIFNLLMFIASKIRIPYYKNIITTIIVFGIVWYHIQFFEVYENMLQSYSVYKFELITITAPFITLFSSQLPKIECNYLINVGFIVSIILIFFIVSSLSEKIEEERLFKIFKFIKFHKNKIVNIAIKEIKILARNEEIVMFNILACIIVILVRKVLKLNISNSGICMFTGALSSFISIYSYGMEENLLPLYKNLGISYKQYTYGKLMGNIIVSLTIYIILSTILFTYPVNVFNILLGLITSCTGSIILYFIGLLFPLTSEKPFMQGLISIGIIFGMIPILFIMSKLFQINKYILYVIIFFLMVTIYFMIFKITKLKWNKES
ncbi:hypothetical protein [Lachnotalea glycerini]|uniref:Uncharacterized protein n=1 Tax=Lachnotalea glycerini TaxID=1763509 RepID=A0A371JHK1_9FIRM|nr:hypothetical protein [Lachnotalea glycerini]RDY32209.1 hypothetical protein CG710_005890 [Lachnotalea glycerini]